MCMCDVDVCMYFELSVYVRALRVFFVYLCVFKSIIQILCVDKYEYCV